MHSKELHKTLNKRVRGVLTHSGCQPDCPKGRSCNAPAMDVAFRQWVPVGVWFQSSSGAEMQNRVCGGVSLAHP